MGKYDAVRLELEERQKMLGERVGRIQGHLRSAPHQDSEERATESENEEVLEQLDDHGLSEIEKIRGALQRIDSGTYGLCSSCGEQIAEKRLEVLPYASLCIECAE